MPSPMNYAEKAVFLDKKTVSDPFGGVTTQWVEGAGFDVLVTLAGSMAQFVAEQRGYKGTYTVTVYKDLSIDFNSVFRLKKDGRIFRITRDPDEQAAPESSTLDYKVGEAELYALPAS